MAHTTTIDSLQSGARDAVRGLLKKAGLLEHVRAFEISMGWKTPSPLVPPSRFRESCERAIGLLREQEHEFGAYLEFGVSAGTSMACMANALHRAGLDVPIVGFDSFQGMPQEAAEQGWKPGQYACSLAETRAFLKRSEVDMNRVQLVKGWFDDTLTPASYEELHLEKASVIMVDCDIYSASKDALWYCEPLVKDQAVVIFDDWGWRELEGKIGQKEAYAEFLAHFSCFESQELDAYRPEAKMFLLTRRASAQGALFH